jgi:hypothetical protein
VSAGQLDEAQFLAHGGRSAYDRLSADMDALRAERDDLARTVERVKALCETPTVTRAFGPRETPVAVGRQVPVAALLVALSKP